MLISRSRVWTHWWPFQYEGPQTFIHLTDDPISRRATSQTFLPSRQLGLKTLACYLCSLISIVDTKSKCIRSSRTKLSLFAWLERNISSHFRPQNIPRRQIVSNTKLSCEEYQFLYINGSRLSKYCYTVAPIKILSYQRYHKTSEPYGHYTRHNTYSALQLHSASKVMNPSTLVQKGQGNLSCDIRAFIHSTRPDITHLLNHNW